MKNGKVPTVNFAYDYASEKACIEHTHLAGGRTGFVRVRVRVREEEPEPKARATMSVGVKSVAAKQRTTGAVG
jgi:hypothetical protein